MKDPYKILGVDPGTSDEDIKKVYRKLALEWHPDRHQGDPEAEERFKEINAAFQAVGTAKARSEQQRRTHSSINMEDLMSQMGFGRFGFNPFRRERSSGTPKIHLPVTLEEAHGGCSKRVTVRQTTSCESCEGRGRTGKNSCGVCSGSGQAAVNVSPVMRMVVPCSACKGSGLGGPACEACGGSGKVVRDRTVNVEVPKGAENGFMLPSDGILVVIQHKPHETYSKLTRTDIISTVQVGALEVMLGTQVSVRTLAGEMKMKVPAGTQPGTRLRIANAGLNSRDGRKGDHIVLVEISIPQLTTEQRRVIQDMRAASAREKDDGYENE